jgi:hypothetical protein
MKTITRSLPRFTLASLCGLLLVAPSFVDAANIVANPSFEANADLVTPPFATAPLTDWTKGEIVGTGLPGQNRVDGLDTTFLYALAPHSGNIAAAFNSDSDTVTKGGVATLTQALTTSTTETYDLSFWLANPILDPSNFNNFFSVTWNGVLLALSSPSLTEISAGSNTYKVAPNTAWFQVTATGLAVTGASTNLVFSGRNSDWATLVDDVSVQASGVPDSGNSVALLGIALAGLVLFARKEQRAGQA